MLCNRSRLRDCESTLLKYFYFVSICKYLLTAGLWEQAFNVTQLWLGIVKFRRWSIDTVYHYSKNHQKHFL